MIFWSKKQSNIGPNLSRGLTLVEVLIAVSIVLLIITLLVSINTFYVRSAEANIMKIKAIFLAEEGIEAARYLRDLSWNDEVVSLTNDTTYYLAFEDDYWQATTTEIYIDSIYERTFTLSSVNRDSNDQIAVSGTDDPGTRLVTVSVAWWNGASTSTQTLSSYINDLFQN